MLAGFWSAARCGRKRRVRMMGAVRLVFTSFAMAVSVEVEGSVREKELMMPALMKTVSMFGKDFVISVTLLGRVWKSVTSSCGGRGLAGLEREIVGMRGRTCRVSRPESSFCNAVRRSLTATCDDDFLSKSVEAPGEAFTQAGGGSNDQDGVH